MFRFLKHQKKLCMFLSILAMTFVMNMSTCIVKAENNYMPITIESYSVTNEKIVPGEEFTLDINLVNESSKAVKNILVDVANPDGVTPAYGTVTQEFVGSIKGNGKKSISLDYTASPNLTYEYVDFIVSIESSTVSNSITVRIPVGTENPFEIVSTDVPESAGVGDNIIANVSFQTVGSENVNDVSLLVKCDDEVIGSTPVGTLTAGATKNQGVTFAFEDEGNKNIELYISYTNSNGASNSVEIGQYSISIGDNGTSQSAGVANIQDNSSKSFVIISAGVLGVVVVIALIILILKKQKR